MIEDKYNPDKKYGIGIDFIIKAAQKRQNNDDDFFVLTVGSRSTGKSRLMLHLMESYMGERASVEYLGLRKGDFAKALLACNQTELPRMCVNDEGNLSSKEGMTKFNRAVVDTYYAIRGKNIFHNWCNPSLQGIQKDFIKEIVNGVIFTYTKYKNVRLYYYFTKHQILDIFEKFKNLELRTLKKNAKKYAHHRSWFKDYNGFLLQPYIEKKDKRMDEKIEQFAMDWGDTDQKLTKADMLKRLDISRPCFLKYEKILTEQGLLDDCVYSANGRIMYLQKHIDIFKEGMDKIKNE